MRIIDWISDLGSSDRSARHPAGAAQMDAITNGCRYCAPEIPPALYVYAPCRARGGRIADLRHRGPGRPVAFPFARFRGEQLYGRDAEGRAACGPIARRVDRRDVGR